VGTLRVSGLQAGYGNGCILRGLEMEIRPGQIVALLGRNGSGRSTLAKALMGLMQCTGSILYREQETVGLRPFQKAMLGFGYVPETRDVFGGMTVAQNLRLGCKKNNSAADELRTRLRQFFPLLSTHDSVDAARLSGGEQQILSLCRTLLGRPEFIILDEPAEGLSQANCQSVVECLKFIRQRGASILLIEQKLELARQVADRFLVMGQGRIVFDGTLQDLMDDMQTRREWIDV
jgi:branched-chain amino acid transport system ATP-binding protein